MVVHPKRPSVHSKKSFSRFTPSLAFQIAGPHTWVAAITPVLLAYTYSAITYSSNLHILSALILLCIAVLMQSAVNVLNDYFDYRKGTDSLDNSSEDPFDAVLVYNNLNPRTVLAYASILLVVAALLGFYLVYVTDWKLLVIGIIGALAVVLYSGGKTPISYLPIGELVSGVVMGGLIVLAGCYVLSGVLDIAVLLVSIPCIIGIGMVLFTNNCCDIEKDRAAKRKTLPVVLGRTNALSAYRLVLALWIVAIVAIVGIFYAPGMPFLILMVLAAFPVLRALLTNPLNQQSRDAAMSQIVSLNALLTCFYCHALACGSFIQWF